MNKTLPTLLIILTTASAIQAQNNKAENRFAIKIYNLTTWNKPSAPLRHYGFYHNHNSYSNLQIAQPTLALQWKARHGHAHEAELTRLQLNKSESHREIIRDSTQPWPRISGGIYARTDISLRYEFIYQFHKTQKKLRPSLGIGISPFYRRNNFAPYVSNEFSGSWWAGGLNAFITPRITYSLTNRLFLDLNIPVCLFDAGYHSFKENNPGVPAGEQADASFSFRWLPAFYSGRLGIGIRL